MTPERVDRLLAALPPQVRRTLGEVTAEELDRPDGLTRVSRERLRELTPTR